MKTLEINKIITREELHSKPVTVRYDITSYGTQIKEVIAMLVNWGQEHRIKLFNKK